LNSRTIVIAGATGLIGTILTKHFVSQGHVVIGIARSKEKEKDLANLGDLAPNGLFVYLMVDLREPTASEMIVKRLLEMNAQPFALINSARDGTNLTLLENGVPSLEQWSCEFQLAVAAPYYLSMALSEAFGQTLRSIINVSSMYGVTAFNSSLYDNPVVEAPIHYGVCKAAQIHLSRELAVRLAPKNIRVNTVSFGGIEGRANDAFKSRYAALSPQNRMMKPDEVIGPVEFLLSDNASAVTGHNLIVDGGWTIW